LRNIKGIIQYDGTGYKGWQTQKDSLTIQGLITNCLTILTRQSVKIIGSGRTDAGAHAIEQVMSFKILSDINLQKLLKSINAILPEQIRVLSLEEVSLDFNPRYDAKEKTYLYIIDNNHSISPFISKYVWNLPFKLNIENMIKAALMFIGEHDFSAFTVLDRESKDCVRKINDFKIFFHKKISFMNFSLEGNFIVIEITANGFLRYMVRNIVGTLVDIGRGKIKHKHLQSIFDSKDRRLAGVKAPAKGLFLKKVFYE